MQQQILVQNFKLSLTCQAKLPVAEWYNEVLWAT